MSELIDPKDPAQVRAGELLGERQIAWLTTTGADGSPRAVPVWFFWHDGVISILSEPATAKIGHLDRDPRVLVHLETGAGGNEVVVLRGEATVQHDAATAWLARFRGPYETKYATAIEEFGMPLDDIAARFSSVIEVVPRHLLTW